MRITNKIMQNNQMYNINNNKIKEDKYATQLATNKKINRPSEDPVIAIRALRLRSNVAELTQYYEKNSKDAESWLKVTEDALSTVTDLLTNSIARANQGANKDLTTTDLSAIISEMTQLSNEYYSTGNVDYGGRYVFTGYRTDTPLTFTDKTSQVYRDIHDGFNAADIDDLTHITSVTDIDANAAAPTATEAHIQAQTMGRLRLSYDKLDESVQKQVSKYTYKDTPSANIKVSDKANISSEGQVMSVTITDPDGKSEEIYIKGVYSSGVRYDSEKDEYTYTGQTVYKIDEHTMTGGDRFSITFKVADDGTVTQVGTPTEVENYTVADQTAADRVFLKYREQFTVPATATVNTQYESGRPEELTVSFNNGGSAKTINLTLPDKVTEEMEYLGTFDGFTLSANSDGTFRLTDGKSPTAQVINISKNGSIYSSYQETTVPMEKDSISTTSSTAQADAVYQQVYDTYGKTPADTSEKVWLNTDTGELMFSEALKTRLAALRDIPNADSIEVVYDKTQWENGDIRPENLFECNSPNELGNMIHYNGGTYGHTMSYDVGYSQVIDVNTLASDVFTTDVKRAMDDLNGTLKQLESLETIMGQLSSHIESETDTTNKAKLKTEYAAAEKARDYLRQNLQTQLEHKITEIQKALDVANLAVTQNGTRSRRLELIQNRLQNQVTTFQTLQSENEDIDLAEATTNLATAQTIYNASLQATGKISQTSLMDYI